MKARFLAFAALVLGMVSCQQDFADVQNIGGEVDFQLSVAATELGKTRAGEATDSYDSAYGAIDYLKATDWTEVDLRYTLEVFDANVDYTSAKVAPVKKRMVKIVDSYEAVNFDLRLVAGRDYRFVVFADFVEQNATDEPAIIEQAYIGKHHIIGEDLRDITVKNDGLNNEYTDAYFAAEDIKITNSEIKSIELKRPYAKVRVVATDLHEINLNLNPAKVDVKYDAYYPTKFNAVTGGIVVDEIEKSFTCEYKDAISKYTAGYDAEFIEDIDTKKPRYTHKTLFTDYILAKDDQGAISFTMNVYDQSGVSIKETKFNTDIPVQRNHLTTIIGNVLTTATEINVTIDDDFVNKDRQYYVFEAFTNVKGFNEGVNDGVVTLDRDYEIGHPIIVKSGIDAVLNLNGHSIKNAKDNIKTDVIIVEEGASLTINGPGLIEAVSGNDGYTVIAEGKVVINGGTFKAGVDENDEANAVVYARGNGEVYVNGGEFPNEANSAYVLNKKDADRATTTIEVRGGRFYNFDPMNNAAENAGTNFCAEGYMSIPDGENWYKVVKAKDCEDKGDYMEVYTAKGLGMWAYLVNYVDGYLEYGVKIMANITMPQYEVYVDHENKAYAYDYTKPLDGTNSNWIPVRNDIEDLPDGYSGHVMGEGHTITGLRVNRTDNYAGFIGFMYNGGSITNLTIVDAEVKGAVCVGAVLGRAQDDILLENIEVKGSSVSGTGHVGGITGYNYSRVGGAQGQGYAEGPAIVRNCTVDANTTVTSSGDNIGGIVGTNYGATIIDCKNYADVTGNSSVGGIVGYTRDYHHNKDGYIVACTTYPEATIKATKAKTGKAGGIAGGVMTDNGHSNTYMHVVACTSFSKIEGATKGCIAGSISGKQHTASCVAVKNGATKLYGDGSPTTESDVEDAILYDAATGATQADVDALNAAIEHFNNLNPPTEAKCDYTWTLVNNFPVLKKN